jgi:hypothetical protein
MSTESQLLANRLNALKSTGPRTIEGKTAASQNAVKHGLLAEQDVISSESEADFDQYRQQLLDELSPVSPMESILAERIVTLSWRLKRVCRFQNQAIDVLNSDQTNDPLKNSPNPCISVSLANRRVMRSALTANWLSAVWL